MGTDLMKSVKRTASIPRKDADIDDTSHRALTSWQADPDLTLRWITVDQFETTTSSYSAVLAERQDTGSGRSTISGQLRLHDKSIDTGVGFVKNYLDEKYDKENAPMYYANFGIVKAGKNYILPRDRSKRSDALVLLLAALITHGFGAKPYGTAYFQPIKASYDVLLGQASTTDSTVSEKVGTKNLLRTDIIKVLNALIHLIRANYPDDWKNKIREWGFQKEKY